MSRRSPGFAIGALGLGAGIALLAAEVCLRLAPGLLPAPVQARAAVMRWVWKGSGLTRFMAAYRVLWEDDPWLRERLRPGLDVVLEGAPEYPRWHVRTSDLGLGGAGFRADAPAGPVDGVVLGDSFGFGVGVARGEVWSERLAASTGVTLVNLCQVGASSLQEARIFERYGQPLAPRLVVWLYFQNDLKENLRFADWLDPTAGVPQATAAGGGGGLAARILGGRSLLYELLLWARRGGAYAGCRTWVRRDGIEFCRDHDICDPAVQEVMLRAGWPLTREALDVTRTRAAALGGELVVVVVPSKEQVYRRRYLVAAGLPADHDVDRLVAPVLGWCATEQVRCLDLTGPLRAAAEGGARPYFAVDIHWNPAGHRLVAAALEDALLEWRLLSPPGAHGGDRQTSMRP